MKKLALFGLTMAVCVCGCCSKAKVGSSAQKQESANLVLLAKAQYERGELEGAEKTLVDCLRADPQNAPARYYLKLVREAEFQKSLNRREPGGRFWYPTMPPRRVG